MRQLKLVAMASLAAAMLALPGAALAKSRDRDHDGMPDRWERAHHLSTHKKNAHRDPDHDGLSNIREFRAKTDPHDADTNGDGIEDGDEGSGTITGFDPVTNVLTIEFSGGNSASGVVNDATRLRCENEAEDANDDRGDDRMVARDGEDGDRSGGEDGDRSGSDSGSGDVDNSGPGSASSGPGPNGDEGDRDDDPGDDAGDDNACTPADLMPGTAVREAELNTAADPDAWTEVELDR